MSSSGSIYEFFLLTPWILVEGCLHVPCSWLLICVLGCWYCGLLWAWLPLLQLLCLVRSGPLHTLIWISWNTISYSCDHYHVLVILFQSYRGTCNIEVLLNKACPVFNWVRVWISPTLAVFRFLLKQLRPINLDGGTDILMGVAERIIFWTSPLCRGQNAWSKHREFHCIKNNYLSLITYRQLCQSRLSCPALTYHLPIVIHNIIVHRSQPQRYQLEWY